MLERQQATTSTRYQAITLTLVLTLLVGLPLLNLLVSLMPETSAEWGTRYELLVNGTLQSAWLHTVSVALLACAIASLIAIPAAFVAVRSDPVIRGLIVTLGVLPLAMPAFVTAGLVRDLLGDTSFNASLPADIPGFIEPSSILLALIYALHFLPLILLSLIAGLSRIDRSLTESASNLGAGKLTVWRRITLPLATPAFLLGASLMLLKIIEDIGAPMVLGVDRMLAPQILVQLGETGTNDPLFASKVLLLLMTAMLITTLAWPALIPNGGTTIPTDTARWSRGPLSFTLAFLLTIAIAVLVLAPYVRLLEGARDSGALTAISSSQILHPNDGVNLTLIIALISGILLVLLAGLSAAPSRTQGWSGNLARFSSTAVFAVPALVLAIAYLPARNELDDMPTFAWFLLALLVAIKLLPLIPHLFAASRSIPVVGQFSPAHIYGLSRSMHLSRLLLPAYATVIAGLLLLGISAALLELSAALILIDQTPAPLAVAVFREIQAPGEQTAASTLVLWLVGGITVSLVTALALLHQRPSHLSPTRKAVAKMSKSESAS